MTTKPRRQNPLSDLLDDPNRGVHKTYGEVGTLARLFRTILKDRNIGGYQFMLLMTKFLNDPKNNIPDNKRDQTSNRGNLNKEFQKGTMTWKVFCKAMRFLQFKNFRLILEAEDAKGLITRHTVDVNLELTEPEVDEFADEFEDRPASDDMPHVPYLDYHPDED